MWGGVEGKSSAADPSFDPLYIAERTPLTTRFFPRPRRRVSRLCRLPVRQPPTRARCAPWRTACGTRTWHVWGGLKVSHPRRTRTKQMRTRQHARDTRALDTPHRARSATPRGRASRGGGVRGQSGGSFRQPPTCPTKKLARHQHCGRATVRTRL